MLGVSYDKVAVRRTRNELAEKVRNDWDKVLNAHLDDNQDGPTDDDDEDEDLTLPPAHAIDWRERTYASSDPSSAEDTGNEAASTIRRTTSLRRSPTMKSPSPTNSRRAFLGHHCMYPDGSDLDGDSSTDSFGKRESDDLRKRQIRKRRRRRRLEEEMSWNDGLRNWEQTRNIWCRAKTVPTTETGQRGTGTSTSTSTASDLSSSPQTSNTSPATSVDQERPTDKDENRSHYREQRQEEADETTSKSCSTDHARGTNICLHTTTLLPVPPPLIPPNDPGRQNITSQYSLIYNKVVTEGLRPQVPINLSHMVPALVKGWKDNDEWPPKSTLAEVGTLEKKPKSQLKGEWWGQRPRERSGTLEGLREGGKRLFGLGSSSNGHAVAKTRSESNRRSSQSSRRRDSKVPDSKSSPRKSSAQVAKKPPEEEDNTAPSMPPNASPRNSAEHEKDGPLRMRKTAKRMSRRLMDSIGGASSETGPGAPDG